MREKTGLEWTILDRIVREGFSEEVAFEQRPECSDIRTFQPLVGLNLECLKEIIKLQVYES